MQVKGESTESELDEEEEDDDVIQLREDEDERGSYTQVCVQTLLLLKVPVFLCSPNTPHIHSYSKTVIPKQGYVKRP